MVYSIFIPTPYQQYSARIEIRVYPKDIALNAILGAVLFLFKRYTLC